MFFKMPFFRGLSKGATAVLLLSSCYKNHLYVQQEWVDASFLASSKIGTPDPRQDNPPYGQRLLVGWKFPRDLFNQELTLLVRVRLWDQSEEFYYRPIDCKWGSAAFYFPSDPVSIDRRILTYKIEVINQKKEVIEYWNHHFWTELIEFPNNSSPHRKSSSVSSQPKHSSVIETP